ncbi:MAG: AI-2E family transporter [Candidatus Paceibacterota bacterium]|jgi:predicted PurR-regulated permease PerM
MSDESHSTISISSGTIFRTVLILLLFVALYLIRDVILIILTSVVIASAIEPATRWLMGYRFPRVVAVISIFLAFFVFFSGFFYFFLPPLLDDLSGFASSIPQYLESLGGGGNNSLSGIFGPQGVIDNLSGSSVSVKDLISQLQGAFFGFSSGIFSGVNIIFGGLLSFILIAVISFYLSVQEKGIENFLRIVTSVKYENYALDLWARTRRKIGLWMQGQLVLGLLIGVFTYLGLSIMNLPYAFLLSVIAALFELIPLFGPTLAAVPAVAIAFTSGGAGLGFAVVGFYIVIQQFENHLIYPLIVRKIIGVPPLVAILALLIFGKLFGFLGLIIAVPAVTMMLEVADDLEKRKGPKRVKTA